MRKITRNIENPPDNFFIDLADMTSDFYRQLGLTPNILTTVSLFFGALSCYLLYYNQNVLAMLCWFIAYYYDCEDGFFARKYGMATKLGDLYDHISDISKVIAIFLVMYYINKDKFLFWSPVFAFIFAMMLVHLGCQEKIYNKEEESMTIHQLTGMCPNSSLINYTKYFGVGTTILVIGYVILTFSNNDL
jgi:phosphatidylglycerophosphate synthase